MPTIFKRLARYETLIAVLLIAGVTGLAYLPLIRQLGLYREDWYLVWSGVARSSQEFISLFQADRPFVGYLYRLVYPFLGATPLHWHIQAFLLRLVGVLAFFWLVRMLWPSHKFATTAAALLFAVYPGYLQQYNAVNKTFWLTSLTLALLSLALTVYAVQLRKRYQVVAVIVLAVLLAAIYPLIIEFYVGFEAVRLLLIWYALQQKQPQAIGPSLKRAALWYLPYLISPLVFLYWRFFVFQSTRPTTNVDRLLVDYLTLPRHMLARLFIETPQDFYETTLLAWGVPPYQLLSLATNREFLAGALLGGVAIALCWLYYRWLKATRLLTDITEAPGKWTGDMIWIGAVMVLITLLPMILAGREVDFGSGTREDHYTIQAALGASIFLLGVFYAIFKPNLRLGVICFLIGVAVMTQYQQASLKRTDWGYQEDLWWQLAWRAPQLNDGTLLLVNLPEGSGFSEGYEAWAPANLIYARDADTPRISGEVLYPGSATLLETGALQPKNHRNIRFKLDFAKALVLSKPTRYSCVNVIDGSRYELSKDEEFSIHMAAPYSNIAGIVTGVPFTSPPANIFGPEPAHTWCYYFQKAMYARQTGDWAAIARLGDEARQKGFEPADKTEWMPFLEGYVQVGRDADVAFLAREIRKDRDPTAAICQRLGGDPVLPDGYDLETILALLCKEH